MNLFKSNKQHISKTEMKDYLNNSLSDKKNSLETAMQNDPFLADSMDGFEQFPHEINNIPSYKNKSIKGYFIAGLSVLIIDLSVF
jgi:hypothetical protein